MSPEPAKRKKVDPPSTGASDGDHRKRRRNRTTQSCLHCHTSKRMCDRKRPCGRCTQLGITGLCVYEVDDPSQRVEAEDDKIRLQKRVAELEGVIRELKSKPHPRLNQPPSLAGVHHDQKDDAFDAIASSPRSVEHSSRTPQPVKKDIDTQSSSPNANDTIVPRSTSEQQQSREGSLAPPSVETPPGPQSPSFIGPFSVASSSSGDSPLATPEFADATMPSLSAFGPTSPPDDAMASLFSYFTNGDPQSETPLADLFDSTLHDIACDKDSRNSCLSGHQLLLGECGCLSEAANYHVVLELSLRLRRAAEVLNSHPLHSESSMCLLKQRVAELDVFASAVLGSVDTPGMSRYPQARPSYVGHNPLPASVPPNTGWAGDPFAFAMSTGVPPRTLVTPSYDSLMSWAPQRHRNVPMSSVSASWGNAASHYPTTEYC